MGHISPTTIVIGAEVFIRVLVALFTSRLHFAHPFVREVQLEDWHLYNFPYAKQSRVPERLLSFLTLAGYLGTICIVVATLWSCRKFLRKAKRRRGSAFLVPTSTPTAASMPTEVESAMEHAVIKINNSTQVNALSQLQSNIPILPSSAIGSRHEKHSFARLLGNEVLRMIFSLSFATLLAELVTDIIKVLVGRPRPDFLDRCRPPGFDRHNPDFAVLGLVPQCLPEATSSILIDGRRSFPSGHSSLTFSLFFWVFLFLYYQILPLLALAHKRVLHPVLWAAHWNFWLASSVLLIPIYTAISRTMDYRHHWEDVFAGSLLGVASAYIGYRHYYTPRHFFSQVGSPLIDVDDEISPQEQSLDARDARTLLPTSGFESRPYMRQVVDHDLLQENNVEGLCNASKGRYDVDLENEATDMGLTTTATNASSHQGLQPSNGRRVSSGRSRCIEAFCLFPSLYRPVLSQIQQPLLRTRHTSPPLLSEHSEMNSFTSATLSPAKLSPTCCPYFSLHSSLCDKQKRSNSTTL